MKRPLPVRVRLIGPPAGPSCCPSSSSGMLLLGGDALLTSQQNSVLKNKSGLASVWKTRKCWCCGRTSAVRHWGGGWRDQSCCCCGGGLEEQRCALGCWGITNIIANDTRHCWVVRHARLQRWPLTASISNFASGGKSISPPLWDLRGGNCQCGEIMTLSHTHRCGRNLKFPEHLTRTNVSNSWSKDKD